MATIVDTGLNRNSYATVAQADDYFNARPNSELWDGLTDEDKSKALIFATRMIDTEFCFAGCKNDPEQTLAFPRRWLYDKENNSIPSDQIPDKVQYAACELAYALTRGDRVYANEPDTASIRKAQIGALQVEFQSAAPPGTEIYEMIPDYVYDLLCEFLQGGATGQYFVPNVG